MNILLFEKRDILERDSAQQSEQIIFEVTDHRLEHIRQVLKLEQGAQLRCGELNGKLGHANIIDINDNTAKLAANLDTAPPTPVALSCVIALPRPKMLRRILRDLTQMGIKQIHLIASWHVDKSYWQTPLLKPENIHNVLTDALSQAMDTQLPEVHCHRRFKPFVEDTFADWNQHNWWLASPRASSPIADTALTGQQGLIIGPERGFTDYEEQMLQEYGARAFHLGPRILRVDTASCSCASILISRMQI